MNWVAKYIGMFLVTILILVTSVVAYAQIPLSEETADPPLFFSVTEIQIQGNTLLPENKLQELIAYLIGDERTLDDLTKATAVVTKAYRNAGFGGVVAFIPEQDLVAGSIIIQVVEGKITNILVSENNRYDENNILTSLPSIRQGETPKVSNINRNIQLANENPAKKLNVALVAGANPGEIDADIKVDEQRPLQISLGIDSAGTPSTGNFRSNVGIQHANLWNKDHIGTFRFQTSPTNPELVQIYSVGYRVPLYNYFSALDLFYAHSNVDTVTTSTPAGPLGFTGKGDVAGFRAHRLLSRIGEYDHRLTFGFDWRRFDNNCSIGGLGSAGCGAAASDVTIVPLSLGYTAQSGGPKLSWGFNTALSGNVGGSNATAFDAVRSDAKKHYAVWRFAAFSNLALPAGFGLAARVSAQYSPQALVPGEQLGLGGGGSAMGGVISVRGYREREVVGDYGSFVNLEGLGPNLNKFMKIEQVSLRPLVFFDFGWAGNNHNKPCIGNDTSCTLASVGGGVRFAVGQKFHGRLDFGHALQDGNQKTAGSTRGHLSVNFSY